MMEFTTEITIPVRVTFGMFDREEPEIHKLEAIVKDGDGVKSKVELPALLESTALDNDDTYDQLCAEALDYLRQYAEEMLIARVA